MKNILKCMEDQISLTDVRNCLTLSSQKMDSDSGNAAKGRFE